MKKSLSTVERTHLEMTVKRSKQVDERNRLCCILSYDDGKDIAAIASILRLHPDTVYQYIRDYQTEDKTKNDPRGGKLSPLSSAQERALKGHLREKVYLNVKDIVEYIKQSYQILYTVSGLTKWLKRQGFRYKKPVSIPGKCCPEKQALFIQEYTQLRDTLPKEEAIFFIDTVHPAYQTQAVSGWILKSEKKHLPTTAKQPRVHYTGALCLGKQHQEHQLHYHVSQTVNQETVIEFFKKLEKDTDQKKLHLICDNAAYFKGNKVKNYLKTSKIDLYFLPAYSPNLNPIERLWKIMRETVSYNRYYPNFASFREAIDSFFTNGLLRYKNKIKNRINDHFQCFKPNLIQLAL